MYQVGIVGCGVIGSRLAEAFGEHEHTAIRAVCDRVPERARSMADTYDAESFTEVETLVDVDALDVVYVGVPPKHHAGVVRAALEAGKHVICEKPIAENATVGRELAALARESDRTTAINFPFRYTPGFVEMRDRIAAGEVGTPKRVSLRFRFPRWPREWQDVDWLAGREQGGPLREVGSHFVFGIRELFGSVDDVTADVRYTAPDRYEESVVGTFRAGGPDVGVSGAVDLEEPVHGTVDLLCDCAGSEENSITVEGTDGSLSLREWRRLVADDVAGESDRTVITEDPGETTLALIEEFVTDLEGGDGDLVSFEAAAHVQAVIDDLRGVAASGVP
ncbi:Gfo/Idh/MocA family protein [Halobiforma nitratireducens]|nr:Gfo/Idh/MocA family oxidoreductase [Halobiforma nitratireducens]